MPAKRVIACLDIDDGRVVKGQRFQALREAGDPVELAKRYEREGADELVVLDISATTSGRAFAAATIASVARAVSIPLTAGGGIRTVDDVARMLDAGADKVSVNSAAFSDPQLLTRAAERFGSQCVVLATDVRKREGGYVVTSHGGTRELPIDAAAWAKIGERYGAGELLVTAIDRDGMADGFDLNLLRLLGASVSIPLIASGGARDAASFAEAFRAGADAALGASIFHDKRAGIAAVKSACSEAGFEVRS